MKYLLIYLICVTTLDQKVYCDFINAPIPAFSSFEECFEVATTQKYMPNYIAFDCKEQ